MYVSKMAINLNNCQLLNIVNPNVHCTQIDFISNDQPDVAKQSLILFEQQIKYIEVEAREQFNRVKVSIRGEDDYIYIDFPRDQDELYDLFLRSVYNK